MYSGVSDISFAEPRSKDDAKDAVTQWLRLDDKPLAMRIGRNIRKVENLRDKAGKDIGHIVYMDTGGFVIVSADDQVEPIIGFCSGDVFDPSPDNPLGALVMNDLPGRIDAVRNPRPGAGPGGANRTLWDHAAKARKKWNLCRDEMPPLAPADARKRAFETLGIGSISDIRVDPFVLSRWNQGKEFSINCYNYYTPGNVWCGCTATAMAQLMRYFQWPVAGVGTNSFDIEIDSVPTTRNLRGGDGAGGPYVWANMVLDPESSITDPQRQAIGALCHDAGVAAHMNYSASGSAAGFYDAMEALMNTFFYSNGRLSYDSNRDMSGTNLNRMINPNLHAKLPVLLAITGSDGGHAVLCDGYGYNSGTLYHHLNMGWSGTDDAWYNLPTVDATCTFTNVYECIYNIYISGAGEIVSGRITDSGGSPLQNALITAQNDAGEIFTATSDSRGAYAVAKVPSASRYWVSVSKTSYAFSNQLADTGVSQDWTPNSGNVVEKDFVGVAASGPDNPAAFAAWARSTAGIDLRWLKNVAVDNVMIAWSTNGQFGVPAGPYGTGDVVVGGGTILYRGSGTNYSHTALDSGTLYSYRAWSVDAGTNYSAGSQVSANTFFIYYVNDTSTVDDAWCAAIGDDANPGTSSNAPKASIQNVLDTYDVEPGDAIYIDTGQYLLESNIVIGASDCGSQNSLVTIRGSPGGTVINRNSGSSSAYGLYLDHSDYVQLRDLSFTSGYYAVYLYYADNCMLSNLTIRGSANCGLYVRYACSNQLEGVNIKDCASYGVRGSYADYNVLSHSVIWSNSSYGVYLSSSISNSIENSTVAYNAGNQIYLSGSQNVLLMTNSIVVASGSGDYCIYLSSGAYQADYNDLYAIDGASVGYSNGVRTTMADWQGVTGQDADSLSADPLFADVMGGDFHLKSLEGRFVSPGVWTNDQVHSPCIDIGSPASVWTNEPAPNGGRINMGAFGNTDQASRGLTNAWLLAITFHDGGTVAGTNTLRWTYGNISTDATVRIEYSFDDGAGWATVTSGLFVSPGQYVWDSTLQKSGPLGRWRVVLESDPSVKDMNDIAFKLRNGPFSYYVNDGSTVGDVYCSVAGNDANSGVSSNAPKASLAVLLASFDLDPGDKVYVDTGQCVLTSNAVCDASDSGVAGNPVVIQGSPGGTVIDRNSGSSSAYGLYLNQADYIELHDLSFTSGYYAVYLSYADNCMLSNLTIRGATNTGIYLNYARSNCFETINIKGCSSDGIYGWYADYNVLSHSVIWTNRDDGVELRYGISNRIMSCTVAYNADDQIYLAGSQNVLLMTNSIVVASGSGDYCIYLSGGAYQADYNDLFAVNGASVGYSNGVRTTLADWQGVTSQDINSLSTNALFADMRSGDFHLMSFEGRYLSPGIWTNDQDHSPCIDAGNPASEWMNEPAPNGGRINMGALGNTDQASKSLTNTTSLLSVSSLYGGAVPPVGTYRYYDGSHVVAQVTNSPVANGATTQYVCVGWAGTGSATNGSGTNTSFSLTNDSTLIWQWRTQYRLDTEDGAYGGVGQKDQWVDAGSNIMVEAAASNYYHFCAWTGTIASVSNPVAVTMDGPHLIWALFAANLRTNGVPECWLASHGMTNRDWDIEAMDDQDKDGMPTWQEWVAGTIPTNKDSVLAVSGVTPEGGGVKIDWHGGTSAWQYLEYREDLVSTAEEWKTIFTNAPPTGISTNFTHQTGGKRAIFYRIRAKQ